MRKIFFSFMAAIASFSAYAQNAAPSSVHATITQEVTEWLNTALSNSPGIFSFELRPIDSRLKLEGCKQHEISVPQGNRLVGNTMLRVKCVDGASWGFNLPVKINIQVQYAVAARPLAANQELNVSDIAMQQGDLGALPGSVILDPSILVGRVLNSAVAAGQTLRQEQIRTAMAITQNQKVKIIFRQDGIEISNEGIAMNAAAEGQPVRVRLDKGKIVTGTAQLGGVVDVGQ